MIRLACRLEIPKCWINSCSSAVFRSMVDRVGWVINTALQKNPGDDLVRSASVGLEVVSDTPLAAGEPAHSDILTTIGLEMRLDYILRCKALQPVALR